MRQIAWYMLDELLASRLEVVKVGTLRAVQSENAGWYREFCAAFKQPRKKYPRPRTIIKRCHTVRALRRIVDGDSGTVYADRLMSFVEDYAGKVGLAS